MDFDLMITSFPKLLSATVITFKTAFCFFNCWNASWFIFCNLKNEQEYLY